MGPITDIYSAIWYGGLLMATLIVLLGSYKGVWRWGRDCAIIEEERDYWRDAFFRQAKLMDMVVPEPEPRRR